MRNKCNPGMLLSPKRLIAYIYPLSHTSILYYYYHIYVKEIFENWIRVVNKNQNTKLSKQANKVNRRRLN